MKTTNDVESARRLFRLRCALNSLIILSGLLLLFALFIRDGKWHILVVVCGGLVWFPALYISNKIQKEAEKESV